MAGNIRLATPSGGSVTLNAVDTANNFVMSVPAAAGVLINADSATGAAQLPVGTTAQRPASPVTGQTRFNTTLGYSEVWNGSSWNSINSTYAIDFVIVAGGGGGANKPSDSGESYLGAGGAGGLIQASNYSVSVGQALTVVVGAGGSAQGIGSNSSFVSRTANGGGNGGEGQSGGSAGNGGSGGGGGGYYGNSGGGSSTQYNPLYGGYGNSGGSGVNNGPGGSGGGAGGAGSTGSTPGAGLAVFGTTYATGGSAGSNTAGAANTGNGGGSTTSAGSSGYGGGSGIVVIRYSGTQRGTGGTVTSSGGYTYHTFTTSGTFTA